MAMKSPFSLPHRPSSLSKNKNGFVVPRILMPWHEDYHWQVERLKNNPHGHVPNLNPTRYEEAMTKFDIRELFSTGPSMKDPLPVVKKTPREILRDFV